MIMMMIMMRNMEMELRMILNRINKIYILDVAFSKRSELFALHMCT